jgi:4-amino-4-deoxy-L-arabinose transferase-like glycosyltransferase
MKMKIKDHYPVFLILIFLIVLKIVFSLTRFHYIHWDESVYLGIGKYIYSFGQVGLLEHIRPPVMPLLLGVFWFLKLPYVFFSELLMLFFSLGSVLLVYLVAKDLFNKWVAVIAAGLLVITPVFLYGTFSILAGVPTSFFILLSIYLYIRNSNLFLVGLFAGMAALTKFPAGLLFLGLLIVLGFDLFGKKIRLKEQLNSYARFFIGFVGPLIPFCIFNYLSYRQYTSSAFDAIFRPWLLGSLHQANVVHQVSSVLSNLLYYPIQLIQQNPLLVFFFIGMFFLSKKRVLYVPLVLFVLYFTLIINKQVRFSLLFLPLVSVVASVGLYNSVKYIKRLKSRTIVYFVLFLLVLVSISWTFTNIVPEYRLFPEEKPEIVEQYYKYFENHEVSGNILSTDPIFVAYSDVKIVPYYNNVGDAIEVYDFSIQNSVAVVYHESFYPCFTEECEGLKKGFFERIVGENELVFNETIQGETRYIFLTPHYYFLEELKN